MLLYRYTRMFENMLTHSHIKVLLNADYREVKEWIPYQHLIYTGPIDEIFNFRYGKLPYRSLEFEFKTVNTPVYQPQAVINYPLERTAFLLVHGGVNRSMMELSLY